MDETATLMILGFIVGWIGHTVIASHIRRAHEEKVMRELSKKLGQFMDEPLEPGVNWLRPDKAHWSNN